MSYQVWYVLRSKQDGQYLAAYPKANPDKPRSPQDGYVLLFQEQADALSYLNRHAPELTDRFATESVLQSQLSSLFDRWGFQGVGLVQDPWLPQVQFASRDRSF